MTTIVGIASSLRAGSFSAGLMHDGTSVQIARPREVRLQQVPAGFAAFAAAGS